MKIKPKYINWIFGFILVLYIWIVISPESFPLNQPNEANIVEVTQGESISPITVKIALIAPNSDKQQASIEVREVSFFANGLPKDTAKFCVRSLVIMVSGNTKNNNIKDFHKFPLEDQNRFCKLAQLITPEANKGYISLLYNADGNDIRMSEALNFRDEPFYYPYDGFQLQIASFITLVYFDNNGNTLQEETFTPFFKIEPVGELNWNQTASEPKDKGYWLPWLDNPIMIQNGAATNIIENTYLPLITKGLYQPYVIKFSRPPLLMIIFPIIIFSFLAFIYLMTLVESLELFFSGAIAVLVGLFGAREVLMPVNVAFGTLVDNSILGLYVVFAISTIVQIARFSPRLSRPSNKDQTTDKQDSFSNNPNVQESILRTSLTQPETKASTTKNHLSEKPEPKKSKSSSKCDD